MRSYEKALADQWQYEMPYTSSFESNVRAVEKMVLSLLKSDPGIIDDLRKSVVSAVVQARLNPGCEVRVVCRSEREVRVAADVASAVLRIQGHLASTVFSPRGYCCTLEMLNGSVVVVLLEEGK